jgi:hypothetical protein
MIKLVSLSFEYNTAVISKKLQYCLLGVWLISSVGILVWGAWPRAHESHNLVVPGFGLMTLEWNPKNRLGDITVVKLTLETISNEEDLAVVPQPIRISSYSHYSQHPEVSPEKKASRVVEARLEIPAVNMNPRDTVGQSFRPGDEVVFYWNINSHTEGDFQGRIWLYIGNQSLVGDYGDRYPITVQTIKLQWRDFFGLSGIAARYIGLFGLLAGILLASLLWFRARQAQFFNSD